MICGPRLTLQGRSRVQVEILDPGEARSTRPHQQPPVLPSDHHMVCQVDG